MEPASTPPVLSTTNRTTATPPMMGLAPPLRTVITSDSAGSGPAPPPIAGPPPIATPAALIERLTYVPVRPSASRREREGDREAHQHPHRPPVRAPRPEHCPQHVGPRGRLEAGVRALQHEGARLGPTEAVDDDLHDDGSRGPGAPQRFRVRERRAGEQHRRIIHRGRAPQTIRRSLQV